MGDIDECEHVFIDGNNLKNRFRDLSPDSNFLIGEIGFGIGSTNVTANLKVLDFFKFFFGTIVVVVVAS